jgi:soluble lytic murein transglycosylase-like protein
VAVLTAASVPGFRKPVIETSFPTAAAPAAATQASARPIAVSANIAPAAEKLATFVARHYRVAGEAAREMVHAAFREGRRNDIDPVLILAVIAVESRFNPVAQSEQGAVGLMQIVPRFHMDKIAASGAPSFLPPQENIAIGTRILKDSIRRGGGEAAGLQLYNGSPDDETKAYANRVETERRRLEEALPGGRGRA